jgi:hypothetical protein
LKSAAVAEKPESADCSKSAALAFHPCSSVAYRGNCAISHLVHVLIFIGLAITLVGMTATTGKPQRMTKEAITRGWLMDALDEALREDKAKPSPVQQFAFNVKHGRPDRDRAA